MLYLVTGTPGAGKTLFTLEQLYGRDGKKESDRPIYIDGINTDLPHEKFEGESWPDLPDESIIVIDEAQRVFRPRSAHSAVPRYVSELETHRHRGIDIWLVTQDALLIDPHVRRLVGQYWRIERPGGLKYAKAKRWDGVPSMNNKIPQVETRQWRYPVELFKMYVSTTKDTHKFSVPKKMIFGSLFLLTAMLFIGFVVWNLFSGGWTDDDVSTFENDSGAMSGLVTPQQVAALSDRAQSGSESLASLSWEELFAAEVPGEPWTAPVYRKTILEEPNPPLPRACVMFDQERERCRCYTEAGIRVKVSLQACRRFAREGWHDFTRGRSRGEDIRMETE